MHQLQTYAPKTSLAAGCSRVLPPSEHQLMFAECLRWDTWDLIIAELTPKTHRAQPRLSLSSVTYSLE